MDVDLLLGEVRREGRDLGGHVPPSAERNHGPDHGPNLLCGAPQPSGRERLVQVQTVRIRSARMSRTRKGNAQGPREQAVAERVGTLHDINFVSMNAVQNVYRVANAVRANMERDILGDSGLSWTSFTALFVLWVWGPQETRHLARECGVTKGTLTGVLATLESKGLVLRAAHPGDGRLVVVTLTPAGRRLIRHLYPRFNSHESTVMQVLTDREQQTLADLLRKVLGHVESLGDEPA